jgi:hypothetical protein
MRVGLVAEGGDGFELVSVEVFPKNVERAG